MRKNGVVLSSNVATVHMLDLFVYLFINLYKITSYFYIDVLFLHKLFTWHTHLVKWLIHTS